MISRQLPDLFLCSSFVLVALSTSINSEDAGILGAGESVIQPVEIPPDGGGTPDLNQEIKDQGSPKKDDSSDKSDSDKEDIDLVKSDSDSLVPILEDPLPTEKGDSTAEQPAAPTNR